MCIFLPPDQNAYWPHLTLRSFFLSCVRTSLLQSELAQLKAIMMQQQQQQQQQQPGHSSKGTDTTIGTTTTSSSNSKVSLAKAAAPKPASTDHAMSQK
jgi:hypothetical protein